MSPRRQPKPKLRGMPDGATIVSRVLEQTAAELQQAEVQRGHSWEKRERQLAYAILFARHIGRYIAESLRPDFPEIQSGENPSQSVSGVKRVDINFSTPEAGLGFAISLKSVHFGEKDNGDAHFTHNIKRNDEELRVEATAHHLRQPYAVLVAVVFLPFESCVDRSRTSSFARWVEKLWPLKGRGEPDDPPDRFELVFVALYARNGKELHFYQVGGEVKCPRQGRPSSLLTFEEFCRLIKRTYYKRNGKDFAFEGEDPLQ